MQYFRTCLGWLLLAALPHAQGAVHVIDPSNGPGTDFLTLDAAVQASADGDFLLLRSGQHPAVVIDAKALVLVADTGASVGIDRLAILNLPAGKSLVVRGVRITTAPRPHHGSILVANCAGSVWLEECTLEATDWPAATNELWIQDCASVVFSRCDLSGGVNERSIPELDVGQMIVLRSSLFVFNSTIKGRSARYFEWLGQDAIYSEDSDLFIQESSVTGGAGGGESPCGNGGDGITLVRSSLYTQATQPVGGRGGCCLHVFSSCAFRAPDGVGTRADASSIVASDSRPTPDLQIPSPVRGNQPLTVTCTGAPGERAFVRWSLAPRARTRSPFFTGQYMLAAPSFGSSIGIVGANGSATASFGPIAPAVGLQGLGFFAQGIHFTSTNHAVLSNPVHVTVLDPSL